MAIRMAFRIGNRKYEIPNLIAMLLKEITDIFHRNH